MKENSTHMPDLNGLRAIAALSVVIAHVSLKGIADFGLPYLSDLPMAGYVVTIFFLIGFNMRSIPALSQEFIAFASLSIIMGQITINRRVVNLENVFFDYVGKISYGIYVIHLLIIFLLSIVYRDVNIAPVLKYGLVYSSVVILTLMIAWLSYTYFEKLFLKFKTRFAVVNSSNSMSQFS